MALFSWSMDGCDRLITIGALELENFEAMAFLKPREPLSCWFRVLKIVGPRQESTRSCFSLMVSFTADVTTAFSSFVGPSRYVIPWLSVMLP